MIITALELLLNVQLRLKATPNLQKIYNSNKIRKSQKMQTLKILKNKEANLETKELTANMDL